MTDAMTKTKPTGGHEESGHNLPQKSPSPMMRSLFSPPATPTQTAMAEAGVAAVSNFSIPAAYDSTMQNQPDTHSVLVHALPSSFKEPGFQAVIILHPNSNIPPHLGLAASTTSPRSQRFEETAFLMTVNKTQPFIMYSQASKSQVMQISITEYLTLLMFVGKEWPRLESKLASRAKAMKDGSEPITITNHLSFYNDGCCLYRTSLSARLVFKAKGDCKIKRNEECVSAWLEHRVGHGSGSSLVEYTLPMKTLCSMAQDTTSVNALMDHVTNYKNRSRKRMSHHSITSHRRQQRKNKFLLPRPSFAALQNFDSPPSAATSIALEHSEPELSIQEEPLPIEPPPISSQLIKYAVFPRCSINLVTCSSNSGKTRFLKNIVAHRAHFFQDFESIQRIVYCNGNRRDHSVQHPWTSIASDSAQDSDIELPVVSLLLEDFTELGSTLHANDIVILDDLLQLTEEVQFIIKYGAHHYNLFVFLVTQTCLSSPLYSLIQSTHNIILIFGNTATTRLAQHLVQSFFLCSDTKAYLKAIFGIAEKQQDVVVLKLNGVASYRPHSDVLALARVQGLFEEDPPYCFVYPELGRADKLESPDCLKLAMEADMPELKGAYLNEAFVLIPAHRVRQMSNVSAQVDPDDNDADDCLKEKRQHWNDMALFLEKEIENSFPLKRWTAAKNLTRELLRCNDLCVSSDFRTVFVRQRPKWKFIIIDFLQVATRKSGPQEAASPKVLMYRPLVNILLRHDTPETFIINKQLLSVTGANALGVWPKKDNRFFLGARRKKRKKQKQLDYEFY